MTDHSEYNSISNWSYVSNSQPNSLVQHECKSYNIGILNSIIINLPTSSVQFPNKEAVPSTRFVEGLASPVQSCSRCEADAAARTSLELELNETKKKLEHTFITMKKKIDQDAAARVKLQLELDDMKKKLNHVVQQNNEAVTVTIPILAMSVEEAKEWFEVIKNELDHERERLSNEQSRHHILLSSQTLSHLLDFSEDSFPVNLTKNRIESKIIERIPLASNFVSHYMLPQDYSWCLERLTNGTTAQKYVCGCIFNRAANSSDTNKQLIDFGAIPILERLSSDTNTDSFVKKMVDTALLYLKN